MVNRRPALYGAAFFTLFIIYGSLYPFNWHDRPDSDILSDVLGIFTAPHVQGSRIDFATNMLLSVPVAFCLMVYLRSLSRAASAWLGVAVLAFCLVLSVTVETLQLDLPGRVSSRWDVLAQGIGALLAIALWGWRGERLWRLLFDWSPFNREQTRWQQASHVYLIGVFAYGLLPLDLTLSPVDVYDKWKHGKLFFLPFHGLTHGSWLLAYQYLSTVLIWAVAALLMRKARALSNVEVVGRTVLAAASLELLQLFVLSRTTDSTDAALAGIAALGIALFTRAGHAPADPSQLRIGQLALWLIGWSCLSLALAWYPFEPLPQIAGWRAQLAQWSAAPLVVYFDTEPLKVATTVLQKVLLFAPWGAIVAWQVPRNRELARTLLVGGLTLMLVVEAGKLFLLHKSSNPSNIAIEAFAMWVAYRWVKRLQDRRTVVRVVAPARLRPWWWLPLAQIAVCTFALHLVSETPTLPYNVRALVEQSALWQLLCFSLALLTCLLPWAWWSGVPPARQRLSHLLIAVVAQPLLLYLLLRLGVPLKLVFDIVGAPVLGWPLELEPMLRFVALNLIIVWGVLSAHRWLDHEAAPRNIAHGLNWLLTSLAVAAVWHVVVVRYACTDNLIELMRGEGSLLTTALLFLWWALLYGSALQLGRVLLGQRPARHLIGIAFAGLLAYFCLDAALEPLLLKYGHVFSAWQFLLSQDRANYAPVGSLALRYAAAHLVLMFGVIWLLLPLLLQFNRAGAPSATTRPATLPRTGPTSTVPAPPSP